MTNIRLDAIDKYIDIASIRAYHAYFTHQSPEKRIRRVHESSRDSARTPVQWSDAPNAGFTTGTPWFHVNPNYLTVNVEAEKRDPNSILHFYRRCLALRKGSEALLTGAYREHQAWRGKVYMYERRGAGERILVICSFSHLPQLYRLPRGFDRGKAEPLLCNYPDPPVLGKLRCYEAQVYRFRD